MHDFYFYHIPLYIESYIVENDSVVQGTIGTESGMKWYVFSLSEKISIGASDIPAIFNDSYDSIFFSTSMSANESTLSSKTIF